MRGKLSQFLLWIPLVGAIVNAILLYQFQRVLFRSDSLLHTFAFIWMLGSLYYSASKLVTFYISEKAPTVKRSTAMTFVILFGPFVTIFLVSKNLVYYGRLIKEHKWDEILTSFEKSSNKKGS